MTDHASHTPIHRADRRPGVEFWLYYALIFLAALPFAVMFRAHGILTGRPGKGVIARAHGKALEITPQIFSVI